MGLSGAAMFAPDGTVLQPSEVLYKKQAASGKTVLISDYFEYYRLAAYIGGRTSARP